MLADLDKMACDIRSGVLKFVRSHNSNLVSNFNYRLPVRALRLLPVMGAVSIQVSPRFRAAL